VSLNTLVADAAGADRALARETAAAYLDALERLMITEEQPAWSTALRDAARLRRAAKRHLVCPSLAAAAMGAMLVITGGGPAYRRADGITVVPITMLRD